MTDKIIDIPSTTASGVPATAQTIQPHESSYGYLVTGLDVANVDIPDNMNERIRQQSVIPAAIKGRLMQAVQDNNATILTVSAYVPAGASVIGTMTVTSTNKGMIISNPYWQVYIDNLQASSKMPQSFSSSNFPFYTWNSLYDANGNSIPSQVGKTVNNIQVRNNAANDHIIYIQAYPRMIINGSGQSTSN